MNADAVLRELEGMRALARSLVHGDSEADDLLQDAAVAALEHPPRDAPPRAWLAVVLRNRRRMDVRASARRAAREVVEVPDVEHPDAALDRARMLERLASALVELAEPFRSTVIRRYLDGQTAAEIAKATGVPAGTVRWRLKTGLERLRAALEEQHPAWRRAFAPLLGVPAVKTKTSILFALIVLLLAGVAAIIALTRDGDPAASPVAATTRATPPPVKRAASSAVARPAWEPLPGQGRVAVDRHAGAGSVSGRVINWSRGDGVEGAELTFTGDDGAITVRSGPGGVFELAPPKSGHFALAAIAAPGYLPYAPELLHSNVHVEVVAERAVRGITVFLFPAIEYGGRVVDAKGAPVAGATVRLLGTPTGEQTIDKLATEWTSGADGRFTFHAADDAVFEAVKGNARGWARLDGDVAITKQLSITIASAPPRDRTLTGRVVDGANGVANVLVRAEPMVPPGAHGSTRATAFATTGPDGAFLLTGLDGDAYALATHAEGYAPGTLKPVLGGARGVAISIAPGATIEGVVESTAGEPVAAYTLLVFRREGTRRELVTARSIVDATGQFAVRVPPGDYDLQAAASGWAPSAPTRAAAGARDVRLRVSQGATLRGQVLAADGSGPIAFARIMREARGGGASAQPANAGTVTRADGTFELTGIPPGPVSVTIGAGGFHPKIESGLTASDGASLGPLTIALVPLQAGETPTLELVGIGVKLVAGSGDALSVEGVIPGGGAEAAGIAAGDEVVAVDGIAVTELGLDGAVSRIRGTEGTTVALTLRRGGKLVPLVVTRKKLRA